MSDERPFPSREDALRAMGQRGGEMRHTAVAKRLGVSTRILRASYRRGGLPGAKEHSPYILMIPVKLVRLAEAYGLSVVERMAKAGML